MKKALLIFLLWWPSSPQDLCFLGIKSQETSPTIGLQAGKLAPCPQKPNCVSSQEEGDHFVKPITTDLSMEEIKKRVLELERARLESEGDDYAHLTFKSQIFGFLDDVELIKEGETLHIRSASGSDIQTWTQTEKGSNDKRLIEKIGVKMKSINPHNGELIKEYSQHSKEEINQIINEVFDTNSSWRETIFLSARPDEKGL